MDKSEQKSFFRWLDTASDEELQRRLLALESISCRLTEPDVIRECRWVKSQVIEEIDIRKRCENVSGKLLTAPDKEPE